MPTLRSIFGTPYSTRRTAWSFTVHTRTRLPCSTRSSALPSIGWLQSEPLSPCGQAQLDASVADGGALGKEIGRVDADVAHLAGNAPALVDRLDRVAGLELREIGVRLRSARRRVGKEDAAVLLEDAAAQDAHGVAADTASARRPARSTRRRSCPSRGARRASRSGRGRRPRRRSAPGGRGWRSPRSRGAGRSCRRSSRVSAMPSKAASGSSPEARRRPGSADGSVARDGREAQDVRHGALALDGVERRDLAIAGVHRALKIFAARARSPTSSALRVESER